MEPLIQGVTREARRRRIGVELRLCTLDGGLLVVSLPPSNKISPQTASGGLAAVDQQLGLNAEVAKIASAAFERVDARVVGLLDERVGPPIVVLERLDGPLVVLFGLFHRGGRADTGRAAGVQLGVPV